MKMSSQGSVSSTEATNNRGLCPATWQKSGLVNCGQMACECSGVYKATLSRCTTLPHKFFTSLFLEVIKQIKRPTYFPTPVYILRFRLQILCYKIGVTVAETGHLSPLIFILCTITFLHFIKQLRMNCVLFVAFISLRHVFPLCRALHTGIIVLSFVIICKVSRCR